MRDEYWREARASALGGTLLGERYVNEDNTAGRGHTLRGVSAEVHPPELAQLIDYAERSRAGDWSLRSALTRYAQPQPQRVSDLLDLVRRIEFAIGPHRPTIERDGAALWQAVQSTDGPPPADDQLLGLLRAMVELDRLGDVLATWAFHPSGGRPDTAVDAVTADVARQLSELGVPREERQPPTRQRG